MSSENWCILGSSIQFFKLCVLLKAGVFKIVQCFFPYSPIFLFMLSLVFIHTNKIQILHSFSSIFRTVPVHSSAFTARVRKSHSALQTVRFCSLLLSRICVIKWDIINFREITQSSREDIISCYLLLCFHLFACAGSRAILITRETYSDTHIHTSSSCQH